MVIPGYDPRDLDEMLESRADTADVKARLTDAEWAAYRNGEESLIDLLDSQALHDLAETNDLPIDVPESQAE
ncbi:hypothetical protein SAMN05216226_10732 [Halovenus aranensis]|jgi:hypothetical protein|uniref:DUF8027 domain-containing protein n=1 Tax=Halovenus aranensis TaxID=890420 RepID=A0A1G8VML9_9EURY|nr:hypothetical protein [Halovenus aranensis]SDJ67233.1 hypothetical protein SAMN05216226_10732 [Halovenus aranensis]